MFTGIITHTAKVLSAKRRGGNVRVQFEKPRGVKLAEGESVAIDGVCSTMRGTASRSFEVDYMPETVARTTVGGWRKGTVVNLELPLRLGDRLGGHLVQGHVDFAARVVARREKKSQPVLRLSLPPEFTNYVVPKGYVAVNGASLTVSAKDGGWFEVSLIPYTAAHTNLGLLGKGDKVNAETDIVGKYLVCAARDTRRVIRCKETRR